ncbi:transposable element Tc1 transposase [Trichonephila clavipes]|nr:transposable element Tc1 transposase [Trichonephila clavipes]
MLTGDVSDESHFHLCPDDHRRRIWRQPGQRADPAFTIARHTGPQLGVMIWGTISIETGPLWSSLEAHLQHIARSTDRSPIEHVWDLMRRRMHLPWNANDLARQLEQT